MDASGAAVQQAYAAWVQAIGSIIGLAIAIYVPFQQRRHEMRQREFRYWTERADVEHRMLIVAEDLGRYVRQLIEDSNPAKGATRIAFYDQAIHDELFRRIAALEARDIGDSGHERVAIMRSALVSLSARFGPTGYVTIEPESNFGRELADGIAASDVKSCIDETKQRLDNARTYVRKFNHSN